MLEIFEPLTKPLWEKDCNDWPLQPSLFHLCSLGTYA